MEAPMNLWDAMAVEYGVTAMMIAAFLIGLAVWPVSVWIANRV
jgi:Flp pilus assembly pilin Flp